MLCYCFVYIFLLFIKGADAKLTDLNQPNGTISGGTELQSPNNNWATDYEPNKEPTTLLSKTPLSLIQNASSVYPVTKHPVDETKDDNTKLDDSFPAPTKRKGAVQPVISVFLSPTLNHNGTHKPVERRHSKLHVLEYVLIPIGSLLLVFLLFVAVSQITN